MLLTTYRALVGLLTFIFVGYLMSGFYEGDADAYFEFLRAERWMGVTVADLYLGIFLACTLIAVLERKFWVLPAIFVPALAIGAPLPALVILWRLPVYLARTGQLEGYEEDDEGWDDEQDDADSGFGSDEDTRS